MRLKVSDLNEYLRFIYGIAKNIMRKGVNAGYLHFLLSQIPTKSHTLRVFKTDYVVNGLQIEKGLM